MDEKFYKAFGIRLGFINGFVFSIPLGLLNSIIITIFLEMDVNKGYILSLILLVIETAIYLGWRYYKTNKTK